MFTTKNQADLNHQLLKQFQYLGDGFPLDKRNIVSGLLNQGADVNARWDTKIMSSDHTNGATPLMLAGSIRDPFLGATELLLARGADINAQDAKGNTALMYAVRSGGEFNTIQTLCEHGANPNLTNSEGRNTLDIARIRKIEPRIIGILQDYARMHEARSSIAVASRLFAVRLQQPGM